MFKWRSLRGGWGILSDVAYQLVPKMRWSMSEGSMSDFEWWWWFDESDIRWRACVVTVRRLNRYEVIEIRWLSGTENFVREMILYSIRSETLSKWRYFRTGVMCWNFGAWQQFKQEHAFWMCCRRFIWYFGRLDCGQMLSTSGGLGFAPDGPESWVPLYCLYWNRLAYCTKFVSWFSQKLLK